MLTEYKRNRDGGLFRLLGIPAAEFQLSVLHAGMIIDTAMDARSTWSHDSIHDSIGIRG